MDFSEARAALQSIPDEAQIKRLRWQLEYARDALQEIADEPVDQIAIDVDWPRRIAKDALEKTSE